MPEPQNQTDPSAQIPSTEAASEPVKPLSPLLEAVKRPIAGNNPCGQEISSSDDDFRQIKEQIDLIGTVSAKVDYENLASASQAARTLTAEKQRQMVKSGQTAEVQSFAKEAGGANYTLIIESAVRILSEKSKDLRVVVYLCFALWKCQRFAGLDEGLAAIKILLQEFGEGFYPPKMRATARKGAIEFLANKLSQDLSDEGLAIRAEDEEAIRNAQSTSAELQKTLAQLMPQWETLLLPVAVAIENCAKRIPKKATPISSPATGTSVGAGPGPALGQSPGTSSPAAGEVRSEESAMDLIRKAATFLRSQDRKNPAPYRLLRSMRWDKLIAEPPNDSGKSKLPAPPEPQRKRLAGLQQNAQWEQLLNEGEASFTQPGFHFWLDLQRMLVMAMDALGNDYGFARAAVLQELAILIQRLPGLPKLLFSDGTRFADLATQSWIDETVLPILGTGDSTATSTRLSGDDSELNGQFEQAKKILSQGDLAGAIAFLQDAAAADASRSTRFHRRLHMSGILVRGNQPKLARPLLEDLNEEIEKFALADWQPSLALEVWKSLHECYNTLVSSASAAQKPGLQDKADHLFERICRLSPSQALAAIGTKPKTKRPALKKAAAQETAELPTAQSPDGTDGADGASAKVSVTETESMTTSEKSET